MPGEDGTATFKNAGPYTVIANNPDEDTDSIGTIDVQSGNLTFDTQKNLSAGTAINIGTQGPALVSVIHSGEQLGNLFGKNVTIGSAQPSSVTVSAGGDLEAGTINTGGAASGTLAVGAGGKASASQLVVANGSTVNVQNSGVGVFKSASIGSGAKANATDTMIVQLGGVAGAGTLSVGVNAPGSLVIDTNSTFSSLVTASIGVNNPGSVKVLDGSKATFQDLTVADTSKADLLIDSSSVTVIGNTVVGNLSRGSVTIQNGGRLTTVNATLGNFAGAVGTVTINAASTWKDGGIISFDAPKSGITLLNGGVCNAAGFNVRVAPPPPQFAFLDGIGTFDASDVENPGIVQPGFGAATGFIAITGAYEQGATAVLSCAIVDSSDYDALAVQGSASLGGSLTVPTIGSPYFDVGQSYTVLTANGISGEFANLPSTFSQDGNRYGDYDGGGDLPALPQGLMWQIGYTDSAVTLTVVPGVTVLATVTYTFDTGSPPAQFTFTRGGPTDDPLTVQYSVGGNAVAGMDYVPLSGTLTFAAGDGSETLNVTGALDAPWHYDPKTMSVSVTPVADSYAADTPSNAAILIYSQPYASINDVTVHTGDSDARFTVSLSNPVPRAASVDFNTEDFNATAPADYAEQHGTLNFQPQETTKYIDIVLTQYAGLAAAQAGDFDPHFYVDLTDPVLASLRFEPTRGTCTILTPSLQIADASGAAGDDLVFNVTLMGDTPNVVTVDYSTSDGTAVDGTDFTGVMGTLIFQPGDTSKQITIITMVSNPDGATRQFVVGLTNSRNAAVLGGPATGVIQEPAPPDPPGSGSGSGGGGSSTTGTGGSSETGSGTGGTSANGTGGASGSGTGGTSASGTGGASGTGTVGTSATGTGGVSGTGTGGTSATGTGGASGTGTGGTSATGTGGTSGTGAGGTSATGTGGASGTGTGGTSATGPGGASGTGTGGTSATGTGGASGSGTGGTSATGTGGASGTGAGGTSATGTGGASGTGAGGTSATGTGGTSAGGTGWNGATSAGGTAL